MPDNGVGRVVAAVFGRADAPPDPRFEGELAEELRSNCTPQELSSLFRRFGRDDA